MYCLWKELSWARVAGGDWRTLGPGGLTAVGTWWRLDLITQLLEELRPETTFYKEVLDVLFS